MTEYVTFRGISKYAQVYVPDEFRGAVRWKMDFYPQNDAELQRLMSYMHPDKKVKEDEDGKFIQLRRDTTKLIKGKLVHFTPPHIYDEDGNPLVIYVDKNNKPVHSFDNPNEKPKKLGKDVLIGNGSVVDVTLAIWKTAMGPGNRIQSIKIVDLIEYEKSEEKEVSNKAEIELEEGLPW